MPHNVDSKTKTVRECNYTYFAYKVEKDENGEYIATKSEPLENFKQRPEGYDYINPEFYTVEYTESKIEDIDNQKSR